MKAAVSCVCALCRGDVLSLSACVRTDLVTMLGQLRARMLTRAQKNSHTCVYAQPQMKTNISMHGHGDTHR